MNEQDLLQNVKSQFIDNEDITLTMSTNFRQIESYDSLTGMAILVMIKDKYGINLSNAEFIAQITINDLLNVIESKINE